MKPNFVNIAIVGAISTGKSTLINAITKYKYSETKIMRTTMQPQIYEENSLPYTPEFIIDTNRKLNNSNYSGIHIATYLIPMINDNDNDIKLRIYDTPGLNDSKDKDKYFNFIKKRFHEFDVIILMIDINTALNTHDEIEILEMLLVCNKIYRNITGVYKETIILINKCDNMYFEGDQLAFGDNERADLDEQIRKIIKLKLLKYFGNETPSFVSIHNISCEDAFIYSQYKINPNVKLDKKLANKFGMMNHGRNWYNLSEDDKHTIILNINKDYEMNFKTTNFSVVTSKLEEIRCMYYNFELDRINYDIATHDHKIDNFRTNIHLSSDKFMVMKSYLYDVFKYFENKINEITERKELDPTLDKRIDFTLTNISNKRSKILSVVFSAYSMINVKFSELLALTEINNTHNIFDNKKIFRLFATSIITKFKLCAITLDELIMLMDKDPGIIEKLDELLSTISDIKNTLYNLLPQNYKKLSNPGENCDFKILKLIRNAKITTKINVIFDYLAIKYSTLINSIQLLSELEYMTNLFNNAIYSGKISREFILIRLTNLLQLKISQILTTSSEHACKIKSIVVQNPDNFKLETELVKLLSIKR